MNSKNGLPFWTLPVFIVGLFAVLGLACWGGVSVSSSFVKGLISEPTVVTLIQAPTATATATATILPTANIKLTLAPTNTPQPTPTAPAIKVPEGWSLMFDSWDGWGISNGVFFIGTNEVVDCTISDICWTRNGVVMSFNDFEGRQFSQQACFIDLLKFNEDGSVYGKTFPAQGYLCYEVPPEFYSD